MHIVNERRPQFANKSDTRAQFKHENRKYKKVIQILLTTLAVWIKICKNNKMLLILLTRY